MKPAAVPRLFLAVLPTFLLLSFCLLAGVSKTMLAAIGDCEAYGYDDRGASGPRSKSFLRMDLSVQCYGSEHQRIRAVAYAFLAVWPLGVPAVFLGLLLSSASAIKARTPTTLSRATSFLWADYQPVYYWWELLAVFHRLSLTAFVLFIPSEAPLMRLCVALLIAVAYAILLSSVAPFRSRVVEIIALSGHALLCFLLLGALMLGICEDEDACNLGFGFADPFAVSLCLLFGSTAMLALIFLLGVWKVFEQRRQKALLSPAHYALLREVMCREAVRRASRGGGALKGKLREAVRRASTDGSASRGGGALGGSRLHRGSRHTPGDAGPQLVGGLSTKGQEGHGGAGSSAQHSILDPRRSGQQLLDGLGGGVSVAARRGSQLLVGGVAEGGGELLLRVGDKVRKMSLGVVAGAREVGFGFSRGFGVSSKFVDDGTDTLIAGNPRDAALGLSFYMGVDDPFGHGDAGVGLVREEVARFVSSVRDLDGGSDAFAEVKRWSRAPAEASVAAVKELVSQDCQGFLNYILYATTEEKEYHNGVRDKGRGRVGLDYFVNHPHARQAGLAKAHVVALRLYTTHAFKYLNSPLRGGKKPHPLPITVTYISEGIKKLRAVYATQQEVHQEATEPTSLWRGMRSLKLSEDFLRGAGGTEVAPMSTTSELSVAVHYGLSANSILFKVRVDNVLQYGADLQWLSAFPSEAEVCFPPLTYLHPTGKTQWVKVGGFSFHVVEVSPTIP